jgi:hypothetical protein
MIQYKKEDGKNLQAYFAGLLALQTRYRTQSDYKTTAVRRFIKHYTFSVKKIQELLKAK